MFRDRLARAGTGARDGIGVFSTNFSNNKDGTVAYRLRIRAYGDFSLATEARMTLQFYEVDEVAALTADWKRTGNGWYLGLSALSR
jgi:hypothetical protein